MEVTTFSGESGVRVSEPPLIKYCELCLVANGFIHGLLLNFTMDWKQRAAK